MTDMTPEPDDSGEQPLADATSSGAIETGDGTHTEPAEEAAPAEETAPADAAEPSGGVAEPGALFEAPEGAAAEPPLRAGLEAILLVVDEPVPEVTLAQILERPRDEVVATLRELAAEYTEQARGFDLREIAGGWRFYTRDVCAPLVERFVRDGQAARLTQAALETLAVIAYRQPVNRARISAIRGVNSDGVIRTLTMRGLIEEAGHDPEHQAVLYRTTTYFLERLGLNTVDELPELAPYLPDDLEGIEELQQ
jgi:segregation and condensation protein B